MMVVDARSDWLQKPRFLLAYITGPIDYLAHFPDKAVDFTLGNLRSRQYLLKENERLEAQALLLQRRVQKFAQLTAENVRLRELLGSSSALQEDVLVAEIVGTDANPFIHEIIIDKGVGDGVFLGMPIVDATGLMGQIIQVGPLSSRGLLITDSRHGIPVEVVRNGVRAIAMGGGSLSALYLSHVADTTDVEVGDILVSSGLGNRFPRGYPVGKVTQVTHNPGRQFASVAVKPLAQIDKSRHILLVFKKDANWFHSQIDPSASEKD